MSLEERIAQIEERARILNGIFEKLHAKDREREEDSLLAAKLALSSSSPRGIC